MYRGGGYRSFQRCDHSNASVVSIRAEIEAAFEGVGKFCV